MRRRLIGLWGSRLPSSDLRGGNLRVRDRHRGKKERKTDQRGRAPSSERWGGELQVPRGGELRVPRGGDLRVLRGGDLRVGGRHPRVANIHTKKNYFRHC